MVDASKPLQRSRQRIGGKRPGRKHHRIAALARLFDRTDLGMLERDVRVRGDAVGHLARERFAVNRKGTARRHGMGLRSGEHVRPQRGRLGFQHAGRAIGFHAFQAVRAHQLGAQARFMHAGLLFGAHLHQMDGEPEVGKRQCRFAAGKAGADDSDMFRSFHSAQHTRS